MDNLNTNRPVPQMQTARQMLGGADQGQLVVDGKKLSLRITKAGRFAVTGRHARSYPNGIDPSQLASA